MKTNNEIMQATNIYKSYKENDQKNLVLQDINVNISLGEKIAIVGPSGAGKTTLLKILSALDVPTKGNVCYKGINFKDLKDSEKEHLRLREFGFVFQNYNLISTLTAEENVMLPFYAANGSNSEIDNLLDKLGLLECRKLFPHQLSGGEQQRVAIARAMINNPQILFADEPTGNLDLENRDRVINILSSYCSDENASLVFVTHDVYLTKFANKVVHLRK